MQNQANVRAFFESWATSGASNASVASMISAQDEYQSDAYPVQAPPITTASRFGKATASQWILNDYGVGLPPLANC